MFDRGNLYILGASLPLYSPLYRSASQYQQKSAARIAKVLGFEQQKVFAAGRQRETVRARSLLCYWAVRELGFTMLSLSRRLDVSVTAVAKSVARGEKLARTGNYTLVGK